MHAARRAHAELYPIRLLSPRRGGRFRQPQTKARVIYEADGPAGVDRDERGRDGSPDGIHRPGESERTEISLPTQHCLPALLPRRLSQGRRARGTVSPDGNPARRHLRGGRSSQRPLDARRPDAALPACPANAIAEVKETVRRAGGWVAEKEFGAGVHEALQHFRNSQWDRAVRLKSFPRVRYVGQQQEPRTVTPGTEERELHLLRQRIDDCHQRNPNNPRRKQRRDNLSR